MYKRPAGARLLTVAPAGRLSTALVQQHPSAAPISIGRGVFFDTDQSAGQIDRRPTGGLTPLKDLGCYEEANIGEQCGSASIQSFPYRSPLAYYLADAPAAALTAETTECRDVRGSYVVCPTTAFSSASFFFCLTRDSPGLRCSGLSTGR